MDKYIKIGLAILFFICLLNMPYGYFQLVRMAGLIGFSILGYHAYKKNNNTVLIIYLGLALLFQPFIKVALGRQIWNIVDVFIGIGLIISVLKKKEN